MMACKVRVQREKLRLRLRFEGREWSEGTKQRNTARNRHRLEAHAVLISEDMKSLDFRVWYLKWFPGGSRAGEFAQPKPAALPQLPQATLSSAYEEWVANKKRPFVRASLARDYRQHFTSYILPFAGLVKLGDFNTDSLEGLRLNLVEERKLSLKTARNVIDGSLRAFFRDLRPKLGRNPFDELPQQWWPRLPQREPDPFTEEERDRILAYYRDNRPHRDYAFVCFRFWTGTRPSEATGLKWGRVDLISGKATITISRHLGEEAAPKTTASRRTVSLLPNVVELLTGILPLRVEPESYVFIDAQGRPVDQAEFGRHFQGVLRVLNIRPRPFYNTRHTYISVALTLGCNLKWISEQTGTSVKMIQEHYGKYIRTDGDALLRSYVEQREREAQKQSATVSSEEGENELEPGTNAGTISRGVANVVNLVVVPTGLEPVFPT